MRQGSGPESWERLVHRRGKRIEFMRFAERVIGVVALTAVMLGAVGPARADYLAAKKFAVYTATGEFPFWSSTWVPLERRIFIDGGGIPYVEYNSGKSYNAT